ncbi:hypothetical protein GCM10010342_61850 [Streptomyces anulatus]|nr:hypothetical protein GCM10010342_61850 [Streptomyces anulatus]
MEIRIENTSVVRQRVMRAKGQGMPYDKEIRDRRPCAAEAEGEEL